MGLPTQDAPYLLEPMAAGYASEEPRVRAALLAAAGRLFFKRPPESGRLLGGLLAAGVADPDQDVHDRALLYYRCVGGCSTGCTRLTQHSKVGHHEQSPSCPLSH